MPYEQAELMAKELAKHHVEHELVTVPDAGHGLSEATPEARARAYAQAADFLLRHLR